MEAGWWTPTPGYGQGKSRILKGSWHGSCAKRGRIPGRSGCWPGSRIAWEATSGLPNRGEVIFSSLSPPSGDGDGDGGGRSSVTRSSGRQCGTEVRLEVSYDAPKFITVLVENVGVLSRFIEKTLLGDLRRFKQVLEQELEAAEGTAEA